MSDMTSTKPYAIAKRAVWEAYQQVKANRGAAGIDGETIVMFEQNLSKNLYKLWNRMSSGSYFPPPVKQVEIPKAKGGTRKLGIPTVSDRIASGLVWVSAREVGETSGCRHQKTVLAIRMGGGV
jgi:retron-type reverse transcriptase